MKKGTKEVLKNNELISKKVNQVIKRTAETLLDRQEKKELPIKFVCECDRADCNKKLFFPVGDYTKLRKKDNQFFVLKSHEDPRIEKVVENFETFLIVEKF